MILFLKDLIKQAGEKICDFKGALNFPSKGIIATHTCIHENLLENL